MFKVRDTNKKALKSGVWYTIANFIVKGATFLTTPIFTRLMSQSDVGLYANFNSWLSIFLIITTFDLYTSISVARFDFKKNINEYISSNLVFGTTITFAFFLIFLAFKDTFLSFFGLSFLELFIIFVYCSVYPAFQMFQLKCRIDYKYKASVFLSVISVLLSIALSLILVLTLSDKYTGRYIGYLLPQIIFCLVLYIYLLAKGKKLFSKKYWVYGFTISFPLIWHALAGNILTSSDRLMIKSICGETDTALYSVAYSCGILVQVLWISMNSAWSPWAMERFEAKEYTSVKKASIPYCLFFGFVVLILLLIAPELLYIMGGDNYMNAVDVIPPIAVSFIFNFVYGFYVDIELYSKKQIVVAINTVTAAILNIVLNLLLIPIFGYKIAAYTTLAGYMALFVLHFISCCILKKAKWFSTTFNLIFLSASLGLMIFSLILYRYNIIRYILILALFALLVIALIIFRKEFMYLIKNKSTFAFRKRFKKGDE